MSRSIILNIHGNIEIGLKFTNLERSPPLKTGTTLAIFNASGNTPELKDTLKI